MNNHNNVCIYDTETSGLDKKRDFVLQLSAVKIDKKTWKVLGKFNSYIKPDHAYSICEGAAVVNGLTKEFIEQNGRPMKQVAPEFLAFAEGCDLCGYNSNSFDIQMCVKDFGLAGFQFPIDNVQHYDVMLMEHRLHPMNLVSVFERYVGKSMEDCGIKAHDSSGDVIATAMVMKKQMETHNLTWDEIDEWDENKMISPDGTIRNAARCGEPMKLVVAVGKYKNQDIYDLCKTAPDWVRWAKTNLFSPYTLKVIGQYIKMREAAK